MDNLIICEYCIEVFNNKLELKNHICQEKKKDDKIKKVIIIQKEMDNSNIEINKCDKTIQLQENKKKIYKCELCNKFETEYRNNYYRHKNKYCKKLNSNK